MGIGLSKTNGFRNSKAVQMVPSKGTKLDSLRKATPKKRVLTMRKPSHR